MKNEKSGLSLARVCAGAVVLVLVPAFVSAQAGVIAECPEAECHVAPFFKGTGGFVGQFNPEAMANGEPLTSVGLVVTCGSITTTVQIEPAADGTVAHLLDDMNGLACHQDGGEIQIHGLMDGGWYWIHDETNSAVEHLLPKNLLGNTQTAPFDASGGAITMTKARYATLVKDTTSGRVGILPHILPAMEPEKCGDLRIDCLVTGEYGVEITKADGTLVNGMTIIRGADDIVLTATLQSSGHIISDPNDEVRADFYVNGPDGTDLPDSYGKGTTERWGRLDEESPRILLRNDLHAATTASTELPVPAAVDASGALLGTLTTDDPCLASSQHRDAPIAVVIEIASTVNSFPGLGQTDYRVAAMYRVACPPLASASPNEGVELVPDNRFPFDQ